MKTPECNKTICACHNGPQKEMSHTPVPWTVSEGDNGQIYSLYNRSGAIVARGLKTRDAALIVRAVNSYEAMLAALKNIRANINAMTEIIERGGCLVGDKEAIDSMKIWAEEAIAQAEAK